MNILFIKLVFVKAFNVKQHLQNKYKQYKNIQGETTKSFTATATDVVVANATKYLKTAECVWYCFWGKQ